MPILFGIEGISCGYDFGEAVTHDYHAPFAFTGLIIQVTVDLSGELVEDDEFKVRMLMARQQQVKVKGSHPSGLAAA